MLSGLGVGQQPSRKASGGQRKAGRDPASLGSGYRPPLRLGLLDAKRSHCSNARTTVEKPSWGSGHLARSVCTRGYCEDSARNLESPLLIDSCIQMYLASGVILSAAVPACTHLHLPVRSKCSIHMLSELMEE